MQDKVSKSKAKCSSQMSGRGMVVSQKKNLRQSSGWGSRRFVMSSDDEKGSSSRQGQTTGDATSHKYKAHNSNLPLNFKVKG